MGALNLKTAIRIALELPHPGHGGHDGGVHMDGGLGELRGFRPSLQRRGHSGSRFPSAAFRDATFAALATAICSSVVSRR